MSRLRTAPTPRGRTARWENTARNEHTITWLGEHTFVARKEASGYWNLYYQVSEGDLRVALMDFATGIRDAWNQVTDWFKTDEPEQFMAAAATSQGAAPANADACEKCGKSGDEKCVTGSGKKVKENGGYHTVRAELRQSLGL